MDFSLGKADGLGQLISIKIDGLGPQAKGLATQIDGIGAVMDGGFQFFKATGRGQKFGEWMHG